MDLSILVLTLTQFHQFQLVNRMRRAQQGEDMKGSDSDRAKVVVLWECFKFQVPKLDCSTMLQSMPIQICVRLA
jgi:hypothetical protein